jgi:hypothetical protein
MMMACIDVVTTQHTHTPQHNTKALTESHSNPTHNNHKCGVPSGGAHHNGNNKEGQRHTDAVPYHVLNQTAHHPHHSTPDTQHAPSRSTSPHVGSRRLVVVVVVVVVVIVQTQGRREWRGRRRGAAAQASAPPSFETLPEALQALLLAFLRQEDVGTLLQLSKGTRQAIAPAMRSLVLPQRHGDWSPASLRGLLQQTINVQRLCIKSEGLGEQSDVVPLLRDGLLPCLTELQLQSNEYEDGGRIGLILAPVLEARRALGLPTLTRLEGTPRCNPEELRRIWACCPVEEVTHLEAEGRSSWRRWGSTCWRIPASPPCARSGSTVSGRI